MKNTLLHWYQIQNKALWKGSSGSTTRHRVTGDDCVIGQVLVKERLLKHARVEARGGGPTEAYSNDNEGGHLPVVSPSSQEWT